MVAEGADGVGGIGGGQSDDGHSGGATRAQAIERVLEDHALLGPCAQSAGGAKVAVGVGLRGREVLRGQYGVEHALELRVRPVDGQHLLSVGAGDHGGLHVAPAQQGYVLLESRHVAVVHLLLKAVEPLGNERLLVAQRPREPRVVDLHQRLAFDLVLQPRALRVELAALLAPEHRVLPLGVENHTVQVEQGSLHIKYIFHNRLQR